MSSEQLDCFLNVAYTPVAGRYVCKLVPSLAQQRLLQHLTEQAAGVVRRTDRMSMAGLDHLIQYLRTGDSNYGSRSSVLPLGARCGAPETAGAVNTSSGLEGFFRVLLSRLASLNR